MRQFLWQMTKICKMLWLLQMCPCWPTLTEARQYLAWNTMGKTTVLRRWKWRIVYAAMGFFCTLQSSDVYWQTDAYHKRSKYYQMFSNRALLISRAYSFEPVFRATTPELATETERPSSPVTTPDGCVSTIVVARQHLKALNFSLCAIWIELSL